MSDKKDIKDVKAKLKNLRIKVNPEQAPSRNRPLTFSGTTGGHSSVLNNISERIWGGRKTLILRDLPDKTTKEDILSLFSNQKISSEDKNNENGESNNKKEKEKGIFEIDKKDLPKKEEIISISREFDNNWSVTFNSEEKCIAAAVLLRGEEIQGKPVHCRVDSYSPPPETALIHGMDSTPFPVLTSPFVSPTDLNIQLERIRVPEGVFGDSPMYERQSIPVSPMFPVLGVPNKYEDRSEKAIRQYKKMLETQQKNFEKSSSTFFPPNMLKSLSRRYVARTLKRLSSLKFDPPSGFLKRDGKTPRYFAREIPLQNVAYGSQTLPISNPNHPKTRASF